MRRRHQSDSVTWMHGGTPVCNAVCTNVFSHACTPDNACVLCGAHGTRGLHPQSDNGCRCLQARSHCSHPVFVPRRRDVDGCCHDGWAHGRSFGATGMGSGRTQRWSCFRGRVVSCSFRHWRYLLPVSVLSGRLRRTRLDLWPRHPSWRELSMRRLRFP